MITQNEKKYIILSMIKMMFQEVWNNLNPIVHLWIVISAVSLLFLYGLMFCL